MHGQVVDEQDDQVGEQVGRDEGRREGDESGTSSSSEEVASSKAAPSPDAIAHLVTLDVDMYFKLQQQCAGVLEIYLVASDLVEKNSRPRRAGLDGRLGLDGAVASHLDLDGMPGLGLDLDGLLGLDL